MKKLSIIVAALVVAGTVSSWAGAPTTGSVVFGPVPITLKATLSDKTKVTEATLTGITGVGGGSLEFATVQAVFGGVTQLVDVIGTGIGTVNVGSTNAATNDLVGVVIYSSVDTVDLSKSGSKSLKLIGAYQEDGEVFATNGTSSIQSNLDTVISNSVLLVSSSVSGSTKSTNVSAKVTGIWFSGKTAVSGTVKSAKVK